MLVKGLVTLQYTSQFILQLICHVIVFHLTKVSLQLLHDFQLTCISPVFDHVYTLLTHLDSPYKVIFTNFTLYFLNIAFEYIQLLT